MRAYVYRQTGARLWTVGYASGGTFEPESEYGSAEEAARRVHFLNGGPSFDDTFNVDRVIPIHSDREVLVNIADLLTRELAELQHIRAALTNGASRSSVEIDSNGAAGKVKLKVRVSDDSITAAREAAALEFAQGMADLERSLMNGWQQTVDQGKAR